jgi:hypothetical protein
MSSGTDRRIYDPTISVPWDSYLALLWVMERLGLTMPIRYSYSEFREYIERCHKQNIEKIVDQN